MMVVDWWVVASPGCPLRLPPAAKSPTQLQPPPAASPTPCPPVLTWRCAHSPSTHPFMMHHPWAHLLIHTHLYVTFGKNNHMVHHLPFRLSDAAWVGCVWAGGRQGEGQGVMETGECISTSATRTDRQIGCSTAAPATHPTPTHAHPIIPDGPGVAVGAARVIQHVCQVACPGGVHTHCL